MFSISTNGVLVYRQEAAEVFAQLVWVDRTGKRVGELGAPANQDSPMLSPDGTRVAVRRGLEPPEHDDIWILDVASGAASRFTFDSGNFSPVWSPDGRAVAFGSQRQEPTGVLNGVFRRLSSGAGEVEEVVRGRYSTNPTDWSRDGKFLVYNDQDLTTSIDIWARPLTGDPKPIAVVRTAGTDSFGQLSSDSHWLAYASDVGGRDEVYVQAFPLAKGKWQLSTNGATQPRWRRDGKELFYLTPRGELMAVRVTPRAERIESGIPVALFTMPPGFGDDFSYDVTADGRRFLVNSVVSDTSQPIVVVLNWPAALKN
jgi:Tol biopolymer transport system component